MGDAPHICAIASSKVISGATARAFRGAQHTDQLRRSELVGDPASFDNFLQFSWPTALLTNGGASHRWKNYHEQWISEGFAHFAALRAVAAIVCSSTCSGNFAAGRCRTDQVPCTSGRGLDMKRDPRVFRALVYNKGAACSTCCVVCWGRGVLSRTVASAWTGDIKSGTEDFERAMEAESGRLDRFRALVYGAVFPRELTAPRLASRSSSVSAIGDRGVRLPVTVTLTYSDGLTSTVVVPADRCRSSAPPHREPVRAIQINQDSAPLAEFRGRAAGRPDMIDRLWKRCP